jgi:catechol 2,3-dioxygenase-like lactoylglutathione lyase family enzyme
LLESAGVRTAGSSMPSDPAMRWWTANRPTSGGAPVRDLFVGDPNGLAFQVVDPSYCGGSGAIGNSCSSIGSSTVKGAFQLRDLSHFTCRVADPSRSVDFFKTVFGLPVQVYQAKTPALGLGDGPQFLMFIGGDRSNPPAAAIDHVCFTMDSFASKDVMAKLAGHGIRARAEGEARNTPLRSWVSLRMPNRGGAPTGTPELYFTDPDGLIVQLQDSTYCGGGGPLGSIC